MKDSEYNEISKIIDSLQTAKEDLIRERLNGLGIHLIRVARQGEWELVGVAFDKNAAEAMASAFSNGEVFSMDLFQPK